MLFSFQVLFLELIAYRRVREMLSILQEVFEMILIYKCGEVPLQYRGTEVLYGTRMKMTSKKGQSPNCSEFLSWLWSGEQIHLPDRLFRQADLIFFMILS